MAARANTSLKQILESEGRSQSWLARRLEVSRQSVGLWVHGIYRPQPETQKAIAELLGRDVVEVFPHLSAESDQSPADSNQARLAA